jgi:Rad3-related DNA helicase
MQEGRPWQDKVARRAVESIIQRKPVLLDGPTGCGKTLIALKVAEELFKRGIVKEAYVSVRTLNEMFSYDRDVSKFKIPIRYSYLVGKRRTCPFWIEGDDQNAGLCDACLGKVKVRSKRSNAFGDIVGSGYEYVIDEEKARRVIREDEVAQELHRGLSYLERKYVGRKDAQICLYHSLKKIPASLAICTYSYLTNSKIREAMKIDVASSFVM